LAPAAVAQDAAPQQPPVRKDNPGVFESIGRFFDRSATSFRDSLQGAKRRMDDLGDEAAANTRDCVAAAEQLCRKNGFATGKSMDFTSAEECPAKAYLNGQQGAQECYTVTFINRAMCQ
jgi:hypothetical protein